MRRAAWWVCLVGVAWALTGCALFTRPADTVAFNRGQFFVTMFRVGQTYAEIRAHVAAQCASGRLTKDFCDYAARVDEEFQRDVTAPLLRNLATPTYEVDWERIGQAVEIVGALAGKALKGGL